MITGALLVALAVGVYGQLGSFGASKIQGAQVVLALSPESDLELLQNWQARLLQWLDREPEDAKVGIYLATRISSRVPLIVPKAPLPKPTNTLTAMCR